MISDPIKHSLWLNTLSYWENCGARKLAACEHPTKVKEEMLKHAAEEFRHAYYLKQQIGRLKAPYPSDYGYAFLIGGIQGFHYLNRLEISICRYLRKETLFDRSDQRSLAYLLVTYAIEQRAEKVYTLYDILLKEFRSPIRIYSILLEEKEHLAEITEELHPWRQASAHCQAVCQLENNIFSKWFNSI